MRPAFAPCVRAAAATASSRVAGTWGSASPVPTTPRSSPCSAPAPAGTSSRVRARIGARYTGSANGHGDLAEPLDRAARGQRGGDRVALVLVGARGHVVERAGGERLPRPRRARAAVARPVPARPRRGWKALDHLDVEARERVVEPQPLHDPRVI